MIEDGRFPVGFVLVALLYWIMAGTIIYALRLRKGFEPRWSWFRAMGAFFLIELGGVPAFLVPVAGVMLGTIIFYAGFKYATGLSFVRTLFLGLGMLIAILALTSLVGYLLGVNLNEMWEHLGQKPY